LLEPLYALGTCTITMRLCPPIVSVRVLEPATAFPQPPAALTAGVAKAGIAG
jgi:hypothetical protein